MQRVGQLCDMLEVESVVAKGDVAGGKTSQHLDPYLVNHEFEKE